MYNVFHQRSEAVGKDGLKVSARRLPENGSRWASLGDQLTRLRPEKDAAVLRVEADRLFQWLAEALGDPRAETVLFSERVERLADVLVQLRGGKKSKG